MHSQEVYMAPETDKTQVVLLGFTSFFLQLVMSGINLALVYYLRETYKVSASAIGVVVSTLQISYVVFCLLLASKTPNHKPRNLILFGIIGIIVSFLIIVTTKSFVVVILFIIIYGFFQSFIWPSIESWLSRGKEEKFLNKTMGFFNLSWSGGTAISTILSGYLIEKSVALPFYVGSMILFFVAFNLWFITNRVPELRAADSERDFIKRNNLVDHSTFLRYYCWFGIFVGYIVLGAISNIFPLYAKEQIGYSESTVGILLWIRGIVSCLVFFLLSKTTFWHFKKSYIFGMQLLIGISCFIAKDFTSILSLSLFFFSFGIFFPFVYLSSMFHGASGSINRTSRMIIHEVLLSVGAMFGSILGGFLYDIYSYSNMMFIFFIFITVCVAIEVLISFIRRNKNSVAIV
jgi:DHA1 family multidrug resistance protein-like MFS transporter/DHA1 family quinolone resistance protein-like MFS transporter